MASNAVACALFVIVRGPAASTYLAEVDDARHTGGIVLISGIDGTLACRYLYSWSDWHGGEALGVKILEVVNAPALVVTAICSFVGEVGAARAFSACIWSWLLAGVFIVAASVQWWLLGILIGSCFQRFRPHQQARPNPRIEPTRRDS